MRRSVAAFRIPFRAKPASHPTITTATLDSASCADRSGPVMAVTRWAYCPAGFAHGGRTVWNLS